MNDDGSSGSPSAGSSEKSELKSSEKSEKSSEKSEKSVNRSVKSDRSEKSEKSERSERSERSEKSEKSDEVGQVRQVRQVREVVGAGDVVAAAVVAAAEEDHQRGDHRHHRQAGQRQDAHRQLLVRLGGRDVRATCGRRAGRGPGQGRTHDGRGDGLAACAGGGHLGRCVARRIGGDDPAVGDLVGPRGAIPVAVLVPSVRIRLPAGSPSSLIAHLVPLLVRREVRRTGCRWRQCTVARAISWPKAP